MLIAEELRSIPLLGILRSAAEVYQIVIVKINIISPVLKYVLLVMFLYLHTTGGDYKCQASGIIPRFECLVMTPLLYSVMTLPSLASGVKWNVTELPAVVEHRSRHTTQSDSQR
jgi:hypothetical protein